MRVRRTFSLAAVNAAVLACALLAGTTIVAADSTTPSPSGRDDRQPAQTANVDDAIASVIPTATAPAVPPQGVPTPQAVATPSGPPVAQPPVPVNRTVWKTGWGPYATVGPVTLHFPGDVVEVVGLHESGHDGAQPQQPVDGAGRIGLMESRARDTNPQGAADIVVDPTGEVRSPVTGTVVRAGTYPLYCDHVDHYLVIEPAVRPGWEVKLLHFEGLSVSKGDRVEAGVTVVGSHARVLPFSSQVDDHTVSPHWPHLHIEVVDPSVPDRPSGGGCD